METILEIEHMSVFFTQYERGIRRRILPVIRDLTLSVGAGQIVAVVGASGSGKSLLAHGILGILPYNSHVEGTIRYAWELLTPERSAASEQLSLGLPGSGRVDKYLMSNYYIKIYYDAAGEKIAAVECGSY